MRSSMGPAESREHLPTAALRCELWPFLYTVQNQNGPRDYATLPGSTEAVTELVGE